MKHCVICGKEVVAEKEYHPVHWKDRYNSEKAVACSIQHAYRFAIYGTDKKRKTRFGRYTREKVR